MTLSATSGAKIRLTSPLATIKPQALLTKPHTGDPSVLPIKDVSSRFPHHDHACFKLFLRGWPEFRFTQTCKNSFYILVVFLGSLCPVVHF